MNGGIPVEPDGVDLGPLQVAHLQTTSNRILRKHARMLPPYEPFLLDRAHGHAVDEQRRRRVVSIAVHAENVH